MEIMGILNLTPDSFSDGGTATNPASAEEKLHSLAKYSDIIDIGAESTRPNYPPVPVAEELRRLDYLEQLVKACPKPISLDTQKATVAEYGARCGVKIINDIWGLQGTQGDIAAVVSKYKLKVIIMHNQNGTEYRDILQDMTAFFQKSLEIAHNHGITQNQIYLDIGLGFGKTAEQNFFVLKNLAYFKEQFALPVVVAASRKSFLTKRDSTIDRDNATDTVTAFAYQHGADIVRVHDALRARDVIKTLDAITGASE